jgi:4-hydroxy-tetrahydrodipicolinate synthase
VDFGRVITAMVTPFDTNLQVDYNRMETLINYLIEEQQSDGLVLCGTTGESPTLTEDEKLQVFEKAVSFVKGRCKIIAGTGSNNTAHSIELTQKAEELGVDGILLVAPYYNRPTQEGLYQHFKAVADATKLPVMLYNIPKRTGIHITAETTIRLSQISNIFATKEASGDLDEITKIISRSADDFLVYSGDDQLTLPIMSLGGYGIVSVASHVTGKEIQHMISAYTQGNVKEAAKLHAELHPIFSGLFICPNPVPVKIALGLHGVPVGGVRLPLSEASDEEVKNIAKLFNN